MKYRHAGGSQSLYNRFRVQGKTVPDWKCLLVKQKYFLGVWLNPGIPFQDLGGTGRGTHTSSHRDHSRAGSAGACHPRALPQRSPLSTPMTEQRQLCESSAGTKETANPACPSRVFLSRNDSHHLSLNRAPWDCQGTADACVQALCTPARHHRGTPGVFAVVPGS